jgi:cytochrome c biogenesis protein ResB
MLAANYKTKKDLKSAVGQPLRYQETSFFGEEYRSNGTFCVVGPAPLDRKWYAEITMADGLIKKVT